MTRNGRSTGRGTRLFVTLVVSGLVLVSAGCDWMSFGYDAGSSRYNGSETTITAANVADLTPALVGTTGYLVDSSPAIAKGVAYVGSRDGRLYAFDASGVTGCDATTRCNALWTADLHNTAPGDPTVANGVVYINTPKGIYAFDAAGTTGCSGVPKTCEPLWQHEFSSGGTGDPVVVNGVLYLEKYGVVYAFDAAGSTGCSGGPTKTCEPLWKGSAVTSNVYGTVAVVNGIVYVPGGNLGGVYAFDVAACAANPTTTCLPTWKTSVGGLDVTVVGGVLYSGDQYGLYAFDATAASCSGNPIRTCTPLWTYNLVGVHQLGVPAVANGVIYVSHQKSGSSAILSAFDATGSSGCSATTRVCNPFWESSVYVATTSSPAVSNGVVFVGSRDGNLHAFDASGSRNCSGTTKVVCTPLWSGATNGPVYSSPAVANGAVYVGSEDDSLHVFK